MQLNEPRKKKKTREPERTIEFLIAWCAIDVQWLVRRVQRSRNLITSRGRWDRVKKERWTVRGVRRELNAMVSRFAMRRRARCIHFGVRRPCRDRAEIFIAFRSTGTGKQSGNLSCRLFHRRGTKLHSVVTERKWRRPCVAGRWCSPEPGVFPAYTVNIRVQLHEHPPRRGDGNVGRAANIFCNICERRGSPKLPWWKFCGMKRVGA